MVSDNFLISEIREGNRMAFTMIYDKYHGGLYAFAFKYLRNHEAAQDVVQHTFVKLWEVRSKLNPCLGLSGYIYRIAKNHTLNLIRNNNFRVSRDMEYFNDMEKTVEMPAGEGSGTDTYTMLNNAIEKLSPQRMAICRMKISEGLSNQEIADRLGISVNTVKNQYSTSIRQLRALMGVGMAVAVVINTLPMI